MAIGAERSSSSNAIMRTPEKTPSRANADARTRRTVGRGRRRRPISTPSSKSNAAAVIDEFGGKENYVDFRSRRRTNTKANAGGITPMKSRGESNRNYLYVDEDDQFDLRQEKDSSLRQHRVNDCAEMARIYDGAFRDFEEALLRISVPSSLWSDFPKLAQALVRISIAKSSTIESLCLDRHIPALLALSRKLIKDVSVEASGTESKTQKKTTSIKDNLFVAMHILRSIAFAFSDEATIERKEALLKMFFHLISSTRPEKKENRNEDRYKSIALAGYEGLVKVLSNYTIQLSREDGKDEIVSFTNIQNEPHSRDKFNQRIVFVIPSTARIKTTKCKVGNMTARQLSTIVFQTTMIVAKAILSLQDGSSLPYGNLGVVFSSEPDGSRESTVLHWHRVAVDLLQQIHEPWLAMLTRLGIHQREVSKEVLSYSKAIHRILWDAASTLKSSSNPSSNNEILEVERACLELRKRAILHLVARTGISKIDLLIRKTSLESGCTYAWKAASVFAQNLSSSSDNDKSLLFNFYQDLDTAFARLISLDTHIPIGCIEYIMHRSLHLESISLFSEAAIDFDQTDIGEDEILNGNYRILLQILNCGISSKARIRHYLETGQRFSDKTDSIKHFISISDLETTIYEFNLRVVHRIDEIQDDSMNRILKLLCNLSLQKTLFLVMKDIGSDKASSCSIFAELRTELLVIATVLSECLGPLVSAYLNHNPQKVPQLAELMMESFLRPLSLYEHLYMAPMDNRDWKQTYLEASMNISKYITEILTNDTVRPGDISLPLQCIEKAAKSIYAIARQRNEGSQIKDSVAPLLFSLKLYDKLDSLNGQKKDYHLSSRLFLLSSTFQSMEMVEESFFVYCLLIGHESEKNYVDLTESTSEENLLSYLGAKSSMLLPPTEDAPVLPQIIRSLCRQMVSELMNAEALNEPSGEPHSFQDFSVSSTMELFFKQISSTTPTIRAPHPLESIELLLAFDRGVNRGSSLMRIFAATEILVQFGMSIQQLSRDVRVDSLLQNFSHLYRLLQNAICNLGFQWPHVFESLIGLVASRSMVPSLSILHNTVSLDREKGESSTLLQVATDIVRNSTKELQSPFDCDENSEGDVDWILLFESLGIIARHHVVLLQRRTIENYCDDGIFDDCISAVERLLAFQNNGRKSAILLRANHWTIWVTSLLQNELQKRGNYDRAAIFSLWAFKVSEKIRVNQHWFRAAAMTINSKGNNLLCLNSSLSTPTSDQNTQRGSLSWIFKKEFQLCELRVAICQDVERGRNVFFSHMQQVEDILVELAEFPVEKSDRSFVLYTWVLSTAYLVQTDIASTFGCYSTALTKSQMCQKCCQRILRRGSFGVTNCPEWMTAIATSTVFQMATQRHIQVLSRMPKLYYRMGDHRKALSYARSLLEYLSIDTSSLISDESEGNLTEELTDLLNISPQFRVLLQTKCWSSTPEITMQQFSAIEPHDLIRKQPCDSDESATTTIHLIQDLITIGDIFYGESLSEPFEQKYFSFYDKAVTLISQRSKLFQMKSLRVPLNFETNLGMPVVDQVKLCEIRRLQTSPHESKKESEVLIRRLCSQIEESEFVRPEDKAWALYYIAVLDIKAARLSGALQELWNDDRINQTSSLRDDEHIRSARYHLTRALLHSSEASDILQRNVLRSLALVEGPEMKDSVGSSAGILILRSIGQSLRRKLKWLFDRNHQTKEVDSSENLNEIFNAFSGPFKSEEERDEQIRRFLGDLATRTPGNWKFIAPAICPSGEMLVSILEKKHPYPTEFSISSKCIFPSRGYNAYDEIMKPLDSILSRVHQQLEGVDPSLVSKSNDKEAIKRRWWDDRNRLDTEMCDLLKDVQSSYFSKILNIERDKIDSVMRNPSENLDEVPIEKLASQFEAASNDMDEIGCYPEEERERKFDELMKLTIPKLKDRLLSAGVSKSQFRKLRKAELIELLIRVEASNRKNIGEDAGFTENKICSNVSQSCLFLILDENLHRFPFEGMPMLKEQTVCRIPCLSFVLATLLGNSGGASKPFPLVNPETASYVLNPENNLQGTQDRLLPSIQDISSSHGWKWDSVVGEIPPASFFSENLRRKDGIMMYFGHGGAQVCFSRRRVDELIEHRGSGTCRSTVLLMGCSSGKLTSINRKKSDSIHETPLYYEPEGVALSYLCAGAPCVIGNLWDVTDNDIDRFSIALMEDFFNDKTEKSSLARSLSISRSVCKLKYLVGCAPVCYGMPVYLQSK